MSVTPTALTITANNQTAAYGAAIPTLTASYSGFVNGDTSANLTAQPTLTTTATAGSPVAGNPYVITANGAADSDYSISYVAGTLNVSPVALTITADNQSKVYGANLPTLTASYSGFVNGDTPASLNAQPSLGTSATATSACRHLCHQRQWRGRFKLHDLVCGRDTYHRAASLTITANNQTMVYGSELPVLAASYSGFVNGDSPASLTTQPTLTTTATAASHVSSNPYTITATGAADSNYAISYVAGTLTVTPAPLTIIADNQITAYGAALPVLMASYSGFVNGDSSASLATQPTLSTTATSGSPVVGSPYAITASGAADSDYSISYVAGALTVTPVPLVITANNQEKVYGASVPMLTASYSGFVNDDSAASLTIPPALSTTAIAGSPVSGNPYSITASGAVDSNYTISYATGTLTITPAALTITADNQTTVYGAALPPLTASYTGFVNGDSSVSLTTQPTLSTSATAHSNTGQYAISASGAADPNYAISYMDGSLTISPAILTVTADDLARLEGQANPPLTYTISGLANGDTAGVVTGEPDLSTTATIVSPPGQYPISVTDGTLSAANYDFTTVGGTMTVETSSAITIGPLTLPAATVGVEYSQQLTAAGGTGTGYSFTATGLPDGLSLSTLGLLSGTPTTATGLPFTVDVTVTDSDGGTGSRDYVLTVQAQTISGVIVTSLAESYYGQEVTLTATFTATPAGSAPMTGTVAFYDGTVYLGTEPLIAEGDPVGAANLSTSLLAVGDHIITATYSGDANYSTSTVQYPVSVLVIHAVTSTTLSASTSPQGTTLTANVVVTSPGNPPLVGTVSFYDGDTLLGTETVTNGLATLNLGPLSPGSHIFRAVFSGGGTFSTSASSLVLSTDGPQVTRVLRYGFHMQQTFLLIDFNGPLELGPAQNPSNYQIVGPGGHQFSVVSAIYDSSTHTVTLVPAKRLNIHRRYRLTINGTTSSGLTNPSGTLLDGVGNGKSGSDYVTSLTWKNLAGRACKLPTLDLVHAARMSTARVQTPPHHTETRPHTAAVDLLLATESLQVRAVRRERR